MARLTHISSLSLVVVFQLATLGCSSSNDPSTPSSDSAGTSSVTTTAGAGPTISNSGGSASQTTGGSGTAGSDGPSSAAGASSSTGGSGTAGGSASTGGTSSGPAGSSANSSFMPLCDGLTTAAGPAPTKAGMCAAADAQLCYKTCGPQGVGFKSETCTAGAYAEQSGCTFPDSGDYSCFKIPETPSPSCPAETITASTACSVAACTPCADAQGNYYDSKMNLKAGYCVCPAPAMPGGMSKWSCASTTAWPCPTGKGC